MYYCASHCHPSGLLFRQPRRLAPFSTFKSPPPPTQLSPLPLQSSTNQPPPYNLIVFLHRTQRKFTIPLKMTRFHSDSMHCMILLIRRLPCSLTNHHPIHSLLPIPSGRSQRFCSTKQMPCGFCVYICKVYPAPHLSSSSTSSALPLIFTQQQQ